ncbi:EamA family transporter [Hyperthermus butylicus]|uniref:EamA domain-containing protein n=1 Tax=Hyperthermus butylicus (strain DSM 5456 / JCM 9403 / PLM1-5) TaxID=415426 RepID=A2BMH9_HYPBU|nr:EamA family transporter [Hyperthermus butylicus]ABM81190.1 hypothetical protein Hbut_1365 [Hyperthermus butylicus DSM 5456]
MAGEQYWALYALGAFVFFGVTNFILKYASVKGIPSIEGTAILLLGAGLTGILATLVMMYRGMFDGSRNPSLAGVDPKYFALMAVAGVTLALGMYFLKLAVATGKAGPATAIALSNAVLVAALAWLVLGEKLSTSELVGMTLYVAAILVFSLKPLG